MNLLRTSVKLVLLPIMLLLIILPMLMNYNPHADSMTIVNGSQFALIETSPFNITHNDNFTSMGFPGLGTNEDPYRIENLSIVVDGNCISVKDTTACFVISNCFFGSETHEYDSILDDSAGSGVILRNASNCRIVDCRFQYKYYGCFLFYLTSNCSVMDNLFEYCFYYGVFTVASYQGQVSENLFNRNLIGVGLHGGGGWGSTFFFNVSYNTFRYNDYGIDCNSADSSIIDHNSFESGGIGIYGWHFNATITNNQIDSMSIMGIQISSGSSGRIQYNQITEIDGIGLSILGCNNLTVSYNLIEHCGNGIDAWGKFLIFEWNNISYHNRGFELQSASDCILRNNIISNGEGYGIYFGIVSNSSVYYNTIVDNKYTNAQDNGDNNSWDDGVSRGNVWSDFIGFGQYAISGYAGSVDRYPSNPEHGLQYQVILPPIGIGAFCVVGLILLYLRRGPILSRLRSR